MATTSPTGLVRTGPDLFHAILLGFPIALFATGLVADIAYLNTAEMQWSNFAAWAIAGALVFGGVVLVLALLGVLVWRRPIGNGGRWTYPGLLAGMWVLGLINAFHHAGDAWSSVGTWGLVLSLSCTVLALAAGWVAFSRPRLEVAR